MANKNGHWYTDKNGNHYFVENGQSPKEGWEASKRRKMISGGKYKVSEDGSEYKDVTEDEYNKYEADETDFDETVDDDFGFDENEEVKDVGLQTYHLDEIESLANNAQEDFDIVRDRFVNEISDLMEDGYDLEDAYAIARDNYIDEKETQEALDKSGDNPEYKKAVSDAWSIKKNYQAKGVDGNELFEKMINDDEIGEIAKSAGMSNEELLGRISVYDYGPDEEVEKEELELDGHDRLDAIFGKEQEFASKYQGRYPLNITKFQHKGNGSYRSIENQEYKKADEKKSRIEAMRNNPNLRNIFKNLSDEQVNAVIEEILSYKGK